MTKTGALLKKWSGGLYLRVLSRLLGSLLLAMHKSFLLFVSPSVWTERAGAKGLQNVAFESIQKLVKVQL